MRCFRSLLNHTRSIRFVSSVNSKCCEEVVFSWLLDQLLFLCSENATVLGNVLVPDAWLVRNPLLRHVLNVNSIILILRVLLGECSSNLISFWVDLIDRLIELVIELVLLFSETVQPYVLVLLVICDQIRVTVSKVFLMEFHWSLEPNLFHATIFLFSLNVWCRDIQSTMCVKLTLWTVYNVLCFPFFMNIYNWLWLRTE